MTCLCISKYIVELYIKKKKTIKRTYLLKLNFLFNSFDRKTDMRYLKITVWILDIFKKDNS